MKRNQNRARRNGSAGAAAPQAQRIANTAPRRRPTPITGVWFIVRETESGKFLFRFKLPGELVAALRRIAQELDQSLADTIRDAIDFTLRSSKTAPEGQGRAA